jgi:membrane protein YdbS with pleckstrin-like domain
MATRRVEITDVEAAANWHRPSPKLRTMRRLEVGLVALGFAVLGGALCGIEVGLAPAAGVVGGVVVLGLGGERFVNRRYASWGYLERDDDLLIRRGVLIKRLSVVPYGRMQFVDVTAGLVERLFTIATLRLHTAAAATDARLPGLAVAEAARLREQLTLLGEARAAGI